MSSIKCQGHTWCTICRFWPELSVSGLKLQFEFTHGFDMMHKSWCSIEEMQYCIPRSSIKFQGHMGQKCANFDPNWAFPDCNSIVWNPWWLWNYAQSLKQHRRGDLFFSKVIHQIPRSHRTTIRQFWPELSVPGLLLRFEFTDGYEMMHKLDAV